MLAFSCNNNAGYNEENENYDLTDNVDSIAAANIIRDILYDAFRSYGKASKTNPDLYDRWEDLDSVVLNSSNHVAVKAVATPWKTQSVFNLHPNMFLPMEKNYGWKLLSHSFKDEGIINSSGYMIMHNKELNLLRVYNWVEENELNANRMSDLISLVQTCNQNKDFFFTFNFVIDNITSIIVVKINNQSLILSDIQKVRYFGYNIGWSGYEINCVTTIK